MPGQTDNLLRHLKARGPGHAQNDKLTELWDPTTESAVRSEAGRMDLLLNSWQQWWNSSMLAERDDLLAWLHELEIQPPDTWE